MQFKLLFSYTSVAISINSLDYEQYINGIQDTTRTFSALQKKQQLRLREI